MNQLEENIVRSFRLCKSDIIKMQNNLTGISQSQERIMEMISDIKKRLAAAPKTKIVTRTKVVKVASKPKIIVKRMPGKTRTVIKRVIAQRAKKVFIASKLGNKLHDKHCPFAKNIHPKSRVIYHSEAKALNKGLTLCECLKKR